ncbi:hypothetical protein FH972_023598 [Carpinus fangiana]|uniref:Apple domain-containing protein n=1 Tax=Carpinus fangiana TaxID=176857 RepID=A0A5N6KVM3_9ROSI|nr:hypothetical protein FH972_023598 [Carpinus fangiana]
MCDYLAGDLRVFRRAASFPKVIILQVFWAWINFKAADMAGKTAYLAFSIYGCALRVLASSSTDTYSATRIYSATGTVPPIAPTSCPNNFRPYEKPGYHCGDFGYNTQPGWLDRFEAYTDYHPEHKCYTSCRYDLRCKSFAYNMTDNYCRTFSISVKGKGFRSDAESDTRYWNLQGCFQRFRDTQGPNLLFNPDFDTAHYSSTGKVFSFSGWNVGRYDESNSNTIPGAYGFSTGIIAVEVPDSTKPGGKNKFISKGEEIVRHLRYCRDIIILKSKRVADYWSGQQVLRSRVSILIVPRLSYCIE